jgi:protein N-terminal methyltransferase
MSPASVDGHPTTSTDGKDGTSYWDHVDSDINGMLGDIPRISGYSHLSKVDLQSSRSFLAKLGIGSKNGRQKVASALEGGAGLVPHNRT